MSYDLHTYRAVGPRPSVEEAEAHLEREEAEAEEPARILDEAARAQRAALAEAIAHHDPHLTVQRIGEDAFEFDTNDDRCAVQLVLGADGASITVPYWYDAAQAEAVFARVLGYLRVLGEAGNHHVYDPQTGVAFEPRTVERFDVEVYLQGVGHTAALTRKKPWWRFW
ncbi:MAG: hypothetical protein IPJ34_19615 [Myxococcales bacterium]|nr:hypothetical protein [Myxococcales bacterium]